ncbi:MAG: SEC-C domain-containing protein [Gammaproteobacteria bacterium]|nr:SEC-C domain-containing protein [Gammaproteobacteria bacterium]
MNLLSEIAELKATHRGLEHYEENENATVLSGTLTFKAKPDGFDSITDSFQISISIPKTYPRELPKVRETEGRISQDYDHIFTNGNLCLGIPVEMNRIFSLQPCLLGFVNRLLVPYFYGFCHWKQYGKHPFGEHDHNGDGIVEYYMEQLNLRDEERAIAFVCYLYEFGYCEYHECPCGSEKRLKNCHGPKLFALKQHHTEYTLNVEVYHVINMFKASVKAGKPRFSAKLTNQIIRIIQSRKKS